MNDKMVEQVAKIIDPVAHERYDEAYKNKWYGDQIHWIVPLNESRRKAREILELINGD